MFDVARKAFVVTAGIAALAAIVYATVIFYPDIHSDRSAILQAATYGLYWGLLTLAVAWYRGLRFLYQRIFRRDAGDAIHGV